MGCRRRAGFGRAAPGAGRLSRPRRGRPLRNGTVRSGVGRHPVPSAARSRVGVPQVLAWPGATELSRRHHPPWTARCPGPARVAARPGERIREGRGPLRTAPSVRAGRRCHPRPARRGRARAAWWCLGTPRGRRRRVLSAAAPRWNSSLRVRRPSRPGGTPVTTRMLARPGGVAPVTWSRIVVPAAPAIPAAAPRWSRVSATGIRVSAPDRLLATAAPAEQPAPAAAALVGQLGKLLEHAVQAIEVGHETAAALRRLTAARRLTATRRLADVAPVRSPPVRTVLVGAPPPGTAPPAAAAFFRFGLDGAGNDPAPARPSLAIRIRGFPGRAGRGVHKRASRRLRGRATPPGPISVGRPRRRVPAPGIPAS